MRAVAQYAMRGGEKLRQHGLVAGRMTVFVHTNVHKPDRPQYFAFRPLKYAADDLRQPRLARLRPGDALSARGATNLASPKPELCLKI